MLKSHRFNILICKSADASAFSSEAHSRGVCNLCFCFSVRFGCWAWVLSLGLLVWVCGLGSWILADGAKNAFLPLSREGGKNAFWPGRAIVHNPNLKLFLPLLRERWQDCLVARMFVGGQSLFWQHLGKTRAMTQLVGVERAPDQKGIPATFSRKVATMPTNEFGEWLVRPPDDRKWEMDGIGGRWQQAEAF